MEAELIGEREEHSGEEMKGCDNQGLAARGGAPTVPLGSGEPLRNLEQDNSRPNAQSGWGVRSWRQRDQPETHVPGGRWPEREDHQRQGRQKPSALQASEGTE